MAIRDQRHANVSKQSTLLADVDVAPDPSRGIDLVTGKCFALRNEMQQE